MKNLSKCPLCYSLLDYKKSNFLGDEIYAKYINKFNCKKCYCYSYFYAENFYTNDYLERKINKLNLAPLVRCSFSINNLEIVSSNYHHLNYRTWFKQADHIPCVKKFNLGNLNDCHVNLNNYYNLPIFFNIKSEEDIKSCYEKVKKYSLLI